MPKTAVLTFHRCINYGSYWQARCLVEGLRSLGADAVLLDHHSSRVNRAEWRCALEPLLPAKAPKGDHALYASKVRKFFDAFASLPLSPAFGLESPPAADDYDVIVVGSDEVWNLKHPWYGGSALFYGEGLHSRRLASYAASFGNYAVSGGLDAYWADRLRGFGHLSVRDLNSRQIVREATGIEPQLVLDPCLKFPRCIRRVGAHQAERPYVAIYGHSFPDWFQVMVRKWAGKQGCELASLGYRNDWSDRQWIDAGPEEFARFMAGALAIVTNFFHGCVFALVNAKPFACVLSDYRSNKLRDLTQMLGAERHLVGADASQPHFEAVMSEPLAADIGGRIAMLRHDSGIYLDHVLR